MSDSASVVPPTETHESPTVSPTGEPSTSPIPPTTTPEPPSTTTDPVTTTVDPTTSSPPETTTVQTTPIQTTTIQTTTDAPVTTTRDPAPTTTNDGGVTIPTATHSSPPRSTQVPITTVISSNGRVVTIVSTSYSIISPTGVGSSGDIEGGSSHTGAIVGGVVGGVVFVSLLGFIAYFLFRRRRKAQALKKFEATEGYNDPFINSAEGPFNSRPVSSATIGGTSSSTKARPLVAPLRPNNPEEEMIYHPGRPATPSSGGYYEEQPHAPVQGGVSHLPGQYYQSEYPPRPEQLLHTQNLRQVGDGDHSSGRNVPHLADDSYDVPHSRQ